MIVWRVEHEDGVGPYYRNHQDGELYELSELIRYCHNNVQNPTHPGPYSSELPSKLYLKHGSSYTWLCGATSLKQLKQWFRGFWMKLHRAGFRVAVYEVEEDAWVVDTYQALFYKEFARKVATYSMMRRSDKIYV